MIQPSALFAIAALLLIAGPASAARFVVRDDAACPSKAQVEAAVHSTTPELELGEPAELVVEVADEGGAFSMKLGDDVRRFDDPARACAERATKIAVVVALAVEAAPPPALVAPIVTPPPKPPPPPSPPSFDRAYHWPDIELEGHARLAVSPAEDTAIMGGAAVRAFVGARHVGAIVGVSGMSPATLVLTDTKARLWRVPTNLGIRGRVFAGNVAFSIDGSLVLGAQITEGVGVTSPAKAARLEVGVEVMGRAELWITKRIAAFVELGYEGIPRAYDLVLANGHTVGHTPQSWLDLGIGVAVKLR